MIHSSSGEAVYRQVARLLAERITEQRPGYRPGETLLPAADMARQLALGVDAVRDAYALLSEMGVLLTRRGYRPEVRTPREREVIRVPPGAVIESRMPTFDEQDEWQLDPGVPMLVVNGQPYPADRFRLETGSDSGPPPAPE